MVLQQSKGKISDQLMQRLKLQPEKIKQLATGLRSIAKQDEPIGKTLSRMQIAEGLELEKVVLCCSETMNVMLFAALLSADCVSTQTVQGHSCKKVCC